MSYQVIARKYRPQSFDDVVGQRLITDTLKNAILSERVAHGYIFSGARGVGKTTTARVLAKALNCARGPTVTPCGECPSCQEIAAGNSIDVLEIDAASNRGIDEIRELRETVRYLPARDRYKIFIIDEAHMLTTEAFNALLKTLEEPPPRSLFILATTEPHKLPSTIQSRCQHFAFRLLDYQEIFARLQWVLEQEHINADEGALSAVTRAAEGSMRDGLSLLDQVIASCGNVLEEKRVRQVLGVVPTQLLINALEAIHTGDARLVLELLGQLATEGYELTHFCAELTRMVRNLMVAKSCGAESPLMQVASEERVRLGELAKLFGEEDLARFFNLLLRVESEMRYSLQPRFHLELGLMKLVYTRRLAPLEGLLAQLGQSGPAEKTMGAGPKGAGTGPARSVPLPVQGAEAPQGSMKADMPPAPSTLAGPPAETRATTRLAATRESTPAVSPVATVETARPPTVSAPEEDARLSSIKSVLFDQSKRFLSSCLDHLAGFRVENGEAQFTFKHKDSLYADLLKAREQQEVLRAVCAQVLGQPVRIYVTLEEHRAEAQVPRLSARERAERDPGVEAFRKKFDGALEDVQDLSQE
ncbi:MAG TPA: DNA polymerase III subunit gamma/tau [Terriglobia bacterium]|nr:DNA polymerase III subunit gamma/tau [Terriglobia bacterium]